MEYEYTYDPNLDKYFDPLVSMYYDINVQKYWDPETNSYFDLNEHNWYFCSTNGCYFQPSSRMFCTPDGEFFEYPEEEEPVVEEEYESDEYRQGYIDGYNRASIDMYHFYNQTETQFAPSQYSEEYYECDTPVFGQESFYEPHETEEYTEPNQFLYETPFYYGDNAYCEYLTPLEYFPQDQLVPQYPSRGYYPNY